MKRRQFIGLAGSTSLLFLSGGVSAFINDKKDKTTGEFVFVEAEQFTNFGG